MSLAPNADVSVYPWKDPPELKARTINRVRKVEKESGMQRVHSLPRPVVPFKLLKKAAGLR
jgi:hypothetical protein